MIRFKSAISARKFAIEKNLCYAISVFCKNWVYVGTQKELENLGCGIIINTDSGTI